MILLGVRTCDTVFVNDPTHGGVCGFWRWKGLTNLLFSATVEELMGLRQVISGQEVFIEGK